MRDIKFKGKRVDNGEWVFGGIYKARGGIFIVTFETHLIDSRTGDKINEHLKVIPETVGQFTGLQSKDGVDIYEGDVVVMLVENDGDNISEPYECDEFTGNVVYCQAICTFGIQSETDKNDIKIALIEDCNIEIIGNIHESTKEIS